MTIHEPQTVLCTVAISMGYGERRAYERELTALKAEGAICHLKDIEPLDDEELEMRGLKLTISGGLKLAPHRVKKMLTRAEARFTAADRTLIASDAGRHTSAEDRDNPFEGLGTTASPL
jgi:hypothetical protein